MKKPADALIYIAVASMVVAIISRLLMQPVFGVFASAIMQFAGVYLLLAIALLIKK